MPHSALITSHERAQLRSAWGSRTAHLTRDSLLPFGACRLCLLPAVAPIACASKGHLFCRECGLAALLAQKSAAKREKALALAAERDAEEQREKDARDKEDREREEFEALDAGTRERKRAREVAGTQADWAGAKRARADGGDGRVSSSFWVPGEREVVPHAAEGKKKDKGGVCPAGEGHEFGLKSLVEVRFSGDEGRRTCPSCDKGLSNATRAVLVRGCGHVLCKACGDRFLVASEGDPHSPEDSGAATCYVCSEPVERQKEGKKSKLSGVVEISCEGTGFAAGGKNQVTKAGTAYQV